MAGRKNIFFQIRYWFYAYTRKALKLLPHQKQLVRGKLEHSIRVARLAYKLARRSGFNGEQPDLAATAGLLHDTGRFNQYRRGLDFKARRAEDHGLLGVQILQSQKVLAHLPRDARNAIFEAIGSHGLSAYRGGDQNGWLVKLLRDADKLDIWHWLTTFRLYRKPKAENSGYPVSGRISKDVLERLLSGRPVAFEQVKYAGELKCLQLSWVNELAYAASIKRCLRKKYIRKICRSLAAPPAITAEIERNLSGKLKLKVRA